MKSTQRIGPDLFSAMPKSGIVHVVMPNMATACGVDFLTAADQGDRSTYDLRAPRAVVSCCWCRSLGPGTRAALAATMQGRQAAAIN